jgi:hypothetical protein
MMWMAIDIAMRIFFFAEAMMAMMTGVMMMTVLPQMAMAVMTNRLPKFDDYEEDLFNGDNVIVDGGGCEITMMMI